jgi:hypothetical protein
MESDELLKLMDERLEKMKNEILQEVEAKYRGHISIFLP